MRRAVFSASYNESATTTSQVQLERILVPLADAFGEPILDPASGLPIAVPVDTPTLTEEVFIVRRFSGSASLRGKRTTATFSLFDERRSFEFTGDDERVYGASSNVSRRLSRRTSANANGNWQVSEPRTGGRQDSRWSLGVGLSHQVNRDARGAVELRHTVSDSPGSASDFNESRENASMQMQF